MYTKRRSNPGAWCASLVLVLGTFATASAFADPPDRVARVGFLSGSVSFQPAGADTWGSVALNRPLSTGDKLYTDRDSRVELEVGAANIRLDGGSTFDLLNLDDNAAQLELTAGVLNLHVRRIESGQSYEIDTPTLAFSVNRPGDYRIDVAPQGTSTMVTVFEGSGNVYGENNASYSVRAGSSYRFNDSALHDYEVLDLPAADEFDRWASSRNTRYERSISRTYVSADVIGVADLDDNGTWDDVPEYGHVWYPRSVEADWAPYRSGHWSWIDPWGWTWVDNESWGFAPFHYGRWAYVGNRWGWCPGQRGGISIYAPALVGFVGGGGWGGANISIGIGGGGPVGWFPLGPSDIYVPGYQVSRGYFTNINTRNSTVINNVNITNVYNNYAAGQPITGVNYAYQNTLAAVTAVPRAAFIGAQPIAAARVRVDANNLRTAQVVSRIGIAPVAASFGAGAANVGGSRVAPPAALLNRQVIARTAPPVRPAPIAARLQAIQRNDARPLQQKQLREIATGAAAATPAGRAAVPSRVQVVGSNAVAAPQPLPTRGNAANARSGGAANERANPAARGIAPNPAAAEARQRGAQPTEPATRSAPPQALPSSRFAPGRANPGDRIPQNGGDNPAAARGNQNVPSRGQMPKASERVPAAAAREGSTERAQPPSRNLPSERFAPGRNNQPASESRVMQRQQATPEQRVNPAVERDNQRAMPSPQRNAPVAQPREDRAPVQRERNAPPQQREMQQAPRPQQREMQQQREAPQQRAMPQQREAPQQRAMPQQREAPQQREMPQQREAPQQRAMPQQREVPQQRAVPQPQPSAQPQQQRRAPPTRDDKKDKDQDNSNH